MYLVNNTKQLFLVLSIPVVPVAASDAAVSRHNRSASAHVVTKVKKNPTCFGGLGFNHFTYFAVLKLRSDNELEGPSARRKTFILGP